MKIKPEIMDCIKESFGDGFSEETANKLVSKIVALNPSVCPFLLVSEIPSEIESLTDMESTMEIILERKSKTHTDSPNEEEFLSELIRLTGIKPWTRSIEDPTEAFNGIGYQERLNRAASLIIGEKNRRKRELDKGKR